MDNLVFLPLNTEHLESVWAIEQHAHSHPWNVSMINELEGRGAFNCAMLLGDEVVGYFYAQDIVGEVSLLNIAIHPQHQGKGLGRQLVGYFIAECEKRGTESAWLEVRESNSAAVMLYLSEGFNEVDRRRDYYPSEQGREDAIIMSYYFLFA
ncbi:ribosomal protein S18-alanine N-acetyltransferase [Vibrio hippocampi]|nr:ribosomal protein S18-alanine N-acetyltransferase [Vibrio hippocampi]